jgi:ketosteroid isomerase-like protein
VIRRTPDGEWHATDYDKRGHAMSTDDNVKTIQSVYDAFARGDLPTILDALTDDVDWAASVESTEVPWWGERHGKEEVTRFFTELAAETEVEEFTPLEIVGDGDVVLTVVRFRVRSRSTGRRASMLLHHYWTFRDGKIASYRGGEDSLLTLRTVTG